MANCLHIKSLDGLPQIFLAFLMLESRLLKSLFAIAHENRRNGGYTRLGACLTLKMGWNGCVGKPAA